ncbi:MAG TPA: hypothetical protein VFQ54_06710, partial [Thermomicrobiales bacterium]|nr:hypothetical protein [Thermomicrobiales bacterium]
LFVPLVLALIGATGLYEPFGDLERISTPYWWQIRISGAFILLVAQSLAALIVFGFDHTGVAVVRNLVAFTGMAACLAVVIDPRQVWVVLLPVWILVFLLDDSRYPDTWPNVLWAWPLSSMQSPGAWVQAVAWSVAGIVTLAGVGAKLRRGLQE